MKPKKLLLALSSMLLLSGCASVNDDESTSEDTNSASINSDTNYDSDSTTQIVTDNTTTNSFDEITMPEENITYDDDVTALDESTTSVSNAGKYYLKGNYSSFNIAASKGTELTIFLDGVNIDCSTGIAFGSSKQVILHLVLLNDSVNTIINDYTDTNAFHVKGTVYISGKGTLNITSKQKNGLKASKNLYIYDGVKVNVNAANHGITAQAIFAKGATLNIEAQKDGIQAECEDTLATYDASQGFIHLTDTNVTAITNGDAIQADTYVYISGGTYDLTTKGEFVPYSTENVTTYGLETDDFKFKKSGSDYVRIGKDEAKSQYRYLYALANSVKGIKAGAISYDTDEDGTDDGEVTTGDYAITIAHLATLTINSFDDCIHTNYGNTIVDSANLTLDTYDDGVHADYNLSVNNASIIVNSSYEGLEGANVTIDGKDTNLVLNSGDDGINAASDLVSKCTLIVNDGYLRVYASGDGLDANTSLTINGGTVIVEGPGSGNGSLDADNIYLNGGIVFACSTNGMSERTTAKQYSFKWNGTTISANNKVSIVDSNSDAIFSYTLKQSCTQIIFSHPELVKNATYKLVSGSSTLASITMTSTYVTSGSSQGGGGGGHGW